MANCSEFLISYFGNQYFSHELGLFKSVTVFHTFLHWIGKKKQTFSITWILKVRHFVNLHLKLFILVNAYWRQAEEYSSLYVLASLADRQTSTQIESSERHEHHEVQYDSDMFNVKWCKCIWLVCFHFCFFFIFHRIFINLCFKNDFFLKEKQSFI